MNFIKKFIYGLVHGTILLDEVAFQCKCVDLNPEDECESCDYCNGTGVVIYGLYSQTLVDSLEKHGFKYIWHKWNPMFK